MTRFADAKKTPLVRIDFSNDRFWRNLVAAVRRPDAEGFAADFLIVNDRALDGTDPLELAREARASKEIAICVFADALTMSHREQPLLFVDLSSLMTLRVVRRQVAMTESNLGTGNMLMEELAEDVGEDGIFRGLRFTL